MAIQGEQKRGRTRLIVSLIISLFIIGFVILSPDFKDYMGGWKFMGLGIICSLVIFNWDKIPKKRPDRKLFTFQDDWKADLFWGVIVGLVFLFLIGKLHLSIIAPGIPQSVSNSPLSVAGSFISVNIIAPLIEETAFRMILFSLFWIILGWNLFFSVGLSAFGFAFYHIWSYGGEFTQAAIAGVSGALFSALLMGVVFSVLVLWRKSISASMGAHAIINSILTIGKFTVVG